MSKCKFSSFEYLCRCLKRTCICTFIRQLFILIQKGCQPVGMINLLSSFKRVESAEIIRSKWWCLICYKDAVYQILARLWNRTLYTLKEHVLLCKVNISLEQFVFQSVGMQVVTIYFLISLVAANLYLNNSIFGFLKTIFLRL